MLILQVFLLISTLASGTLEKDSVKSKLHSMMKHQIGVMIFAPFQLTQFLVLNTA
jgi:hypothetical protein